MEVLRVCRLEVAHWPRTEALLDRVLGGRMQARLGEIVDVLALQGLIAEDEHGLAGVVTYQVVEGACELVSIACARPQRGVGTMLLNALIAEVRARCSHIWLVTTNDNLDALRFYQRRGFRLRAVRSGAVDDARRRLKPTLPALGAYGIPMRDELELELVDLERPVE
jgi:ribosomal protein S18 acetylase RimI-like enzyme